MTIEHDVQHIKASDDQARMVAALQRDGAVIVEGFLSDDLLARLNAEIEPVLAATSRGESDMFNPFFTWFYGRQTLTITGLAGKPSVFATELLTHPLYRAMCDEILLPNCACYRLNVAQVLDRGPGSEQQLVHRDEAAWPHLFQPHPEVQVASVIALEDFTAANGATRVVPGSHRWPRVREAEPGELVPAEMPAGSAVVYLGSTIHGGGANTTTDVLRRGMHVSFCLGWLHTEENQYVATPLETVRSLPRESQALLGYAIHDGLAIGGGYLGAVELQDPLELLALGVL
jgi:hypothetical protein